MDYLIICLFAFFGAGLTLFSGFGLGTILLPIFGLFFPIEIAVLMTALVHFTNNVLKLILFGRKANRSIVLKFGIPAIITAIIGAYVLSLLTNCNPIADYIIFSKKFEITYLKLTIGLLLIFFALFDYIPKLKKIKFDKKYLFFGGILSGFFGGISGHQGALRSAFLIKSGLSKESFIATGVMIACLVDISRLSIYIPKIIGNEINLNYKMLVTATISAFIGVYFGAKALNKITLKIIKNLVCAALLLYGLLIIIGII